MTVHRPRHTGRLLAASAAALALLVPAAGPSAAAPAPTASGGGAVSRWNDAAGRAAVAACIAPVGNPLFESRLYAMTHLAVHDALAAIDRRSRPYAFHGEARDGTSPAAAVASAAYAVLVPGIRALPTGDACTAAGVEVVRQQYRRELAGVPDAGPRRRGMALGRQAAAAIMRVRAHDGSDTELVDTDFPEGTRPGEYRFTTGAPFAFAPGWGDVTPFALSSSRQYRPGPPPRVSSRAYAADVREVQRLGGDGVTTRSARTPDQSEIAIFWDESSPLMWNRIARIAATRAHLDLWEEARLYALLNVALADGYIGSFETKYHYLFWRPETAIREAAHDGNPATRADPTWTPFVSTPPVPDYDSAHAVEGAAAARVLGRLLGNRTTVTTCSNRFDDARACSGSSPAMRTWSSFSQAAAENGVSRILIGFHFRTAVKVGLVHGRRIGDRAVDHVLRLHG